MKSIALEVESKLDLLISDHEENEAETALEEAIAEAIKNSKQNLGMAQ